MSDEAPTLPARLSRRATPLGRLAAGVVLGSFLAGPALWGRTMRPASAERYGFPAAPPPAARLSPDARMAAATALRDALEDRAFPGAALAMGVGEGVDVELAVGNLVWSRAAPPVLPGETRYDLASLTKAVATTTAVLLLAEDGRIRLDEPVRRWLPEFEGVHKDGVTWRHLLTHTSGLAPGAWIRGSTPEERLRRVLRTRLAAPPGRYVQYSDVGFLVLWAAAERAAGEPLDGFLERRLWRPLGMHATEFSPGDDCEPCAPTLRLRSGERFRGRPNDLWARRLGGVAGNAGLFSTARDLGRFAAMIAGGGELDGVRILTPESVAELFRQQPGAGRRTLGWQAICPDEPPRDHRPCERPLAYGQRGWTGTSLWVDPETRTWVVLLSNRSYNTREPRDLDPLRQRLMRTAVEDQRGASRT